MPGFVEIKFPQIDSLGATVGGYDYPGDLYSSVISISGDVFDLLIHNGYNPEDFNTITWPVGAGSYGTGMFLVSKHTLRLLNEISSSGEDVELDPEDGPKPEAQKREPIQLSFDGMLFDRMYMRAPKPLLPSHKNNEIDFYVIELVDERYWWQLHPIKDKYKAANPDPETEDDDHSDGMFKHGLNMIDPDERSGFMKNSLFPQVPEDQEFWFPWTLLDVMNSILSRGGAEYTDMKGQEEFTFLNESDWSYSDDLLDYPSLLDILNYHPVGRPFGEFLDTIFTMTGYVLVAHPNDDIRYRIMPIKDESNQAGLFHQWVKGTIVSGGMSASFGLDGQEYPAGYAGQPIVPVESLRSEIPSEMIVMFPKTNDNGDAPNDGDLSYVTDRWASIETTNGRPRLFSRERKHSIYAPFNARFEVSEDNEGMEWVNKDDCQDWANQLSSRFYDRFKAGTCDVLLWGTYGVAGGIMFLWPGAQEIIWSLSDQGPVTRIRGSYDHPLFGFSKEEQLHQGSIVTTGGSRVIPKADGGVLIESIGGAGAMSLHQGVISGWDNNVPVYNSKYFARSTTDPNLSIGPIQPIRTHSTAYVNCQPLQINDPCIIGLIPENYLSDAHEVVDAGPGRMTVSGSGDLLGGFGFFERLMGGTPVDSGTSFEYFRLEDGRICVLYVFEIPSTVRCELLSQPGAAASSTRNQESFYTRSNLYGY